MYQVTFDKSMSRYGWREGGVGDTVCTDSCLRGTYCRFPSLQAALI